MVTRGPSPTGAPAPLHPRTGRPIFYPQWLNPAEDRIARNGRIVRKSSLQNLACMRPCRSPREKFVLEQLAWQWWLSREPGRKWGVHRTGKLLGVSGQAIYQLARKFRANSDVWRRRFAPFPWATFADLLEAREETRLWRERGWLRNPIRSRRVAYTWEGKRRKQTIFTRAELRRRAAAAARHPRLSPRQRALAARRLRAKWRRYPPCPLAIQHYWRNDGSCRCGLTRSPFPVVANHPAKPRRFPPCPLATAVAGRTARAHDFRPRGVCRCGLRRADFPPLAKRPPRPAPLPVRRPDGGLYISCSPVTRDAHGQWMGRNGLPFDPARLSRDQLPFWARGLDFQLPPSPPAPGASTLFGPAPPADRATPRPVPFAFRRRPRR